MSPGRKALLVAATVSAAMVAVPSVAAAAEWTRLGTTPYGSNLPVASLRLDAGKVSAAWWVPRAGGDGLEGATFAPSIAGAGRAATAVSLTSGWATLDDPVLVPGTDRVLLSGIHSVTTGDPNNGDNIGGFGAGLPGLTPLRNTLNAFTADNGLSDAIVGPDGAVYYVTAKAGGLSVRRASAPDVGVLDIAAALGPGFSNYVPRFGTAGGRYWIAWYAIAPAGRPSGLYVAQVTLAASGSAIVGSPVLVPQSGSSDNNTLSVPFACSSRDCRVVYHQTGAQNLDTGRILTWSASAQGAPTVAVAGAQPAPNMAAAYRDDAHLWIVWLDRAGSTSYRYTLGDAVGAGGAAGSLGLPTAGTLTAGYAISAIGAGGNLVVATNWLQDNVGRQWVTVAAPPSSAGVPDTTGIPNPRVIRRGPAIYVVPRRPSLARLRKTKCVNVRVQSTRPAAVNVAIFSGRKSVRIFGQRVVRFTAPGKRLVCIKVPLRARTFDVRQPFRFAFAYKLGAHPKATARATVTTSGFTSFK